MQKIRDIRDQRLVTTDGGRELIATFERIQTPLLGVILADKLLTQEAMSLLDRVQKLTGNDKAIVSARDLKRGLAFVDSLIRASSDSVRRDLATVRKQLMKAGGKSVRAIVEDLIKSQRRPVKKSPKRPPQAGKRRGAGRGSNPPRAQSKRPSSKSKR